ncbi:MAG: cytochrome c biogenesis protein ResB [Candidatus Omnitrophica bacterium]|nr:cytochrome c biogenesis protein ResB [Candidatus Omnitrophota bacterium]MBU4479275.1 cytochrome c biogenesis protein ResB [Candidatus Omnitrophota bacterium]MCG2703256.1 cytochrome c biogenesis protein ResB [Candidatus Omnitrophota bacterium]
MKFLKYLVSLKMALFFVHCSVLVIFFGAFISKTLRYERNYRIFPGGAIILPHAGGKVVLNDFAIDYYPGTFQPKEYRSRVCLPETGGPIKEYDIRVNHPLRYKGYSLYQASFEITAEVEIKLIHAQRVIWEGAWQPGDCLGIPGNSDLRVKFTRFLPDVYEDEKGIRQVRMDAVRNPAMELHIYNRGRLVQQQLVFCDGRKNKRKAGEEVLFEWQIKNFTTRSASILQVVKDPGVAIIWTGFIMLFLGLGMLLFKRQL